MSGEPYVGLRAYDTGDQDRFYGRSSECRDVSMLWQSNRLLVIYGPSGVGKTSLVQAGVISRFDRAKSVDVLPVGRVSRRSAFPTAALPEHNPHTFALLSSWSPADSPTRLVGLTLKEFLNRRGVPTDRYGDPLPVLAAIDQFEELFNDFRHRQRYIDEFIDHLADAVEALPRLRLLISIREEALANLIPRETRLAGRSWARLRVLPLARNAALEAVTGPLVGTGRSFAPGVAEKLVDDLRTVELTSRVGETTKVTTEFVEPVQLQVVCSALWRALPEQVTTITDEHLHHLGDVDRTLAEFCARMVTEVAGEYQILEQELHEWLERIFITELGTRGVAYEGSSMTGGMPNSIARALEDRHILKSEWRSRSRWYELQHDRLIESIQQARRPHVIAAETFFGVSPDDYLRIAESALSDGELKLAEKHAKEALRMCSDYDARTRAEAESFLGNIAFQAGKLDMAERHYQQAAQHFETLQDLAAVGRLLTAIGQLLLARGSYLAALNLLQAAVTRLPGDQTVRVMLARALWSSGQLRPAAAVLSDALKIAPDEAEALSLRGQILVELMDPVSAFKDLDNLVRLRPDIGRYAEVRAARALALAQIGRIQEAVAKANAAVDDAPNSGPVLLRASGVARAAGEPMRADDLLLRARDARDPALFPHQLAEVHRLLHKSSGESGA
ncbi:MAG: tetratricopeptide repeat protein [Egibacteraceae bacterium]